MNSSCLSIANLSIRFHTYDGIAAVVDDVSLHVQKGESVGLVGETGCGKSVTLKAVLGILPTPPALPPSGKIVFQGIELTQLAHGARRELMGKEIAMIPQNAMTSLNPTLKIKDQIADLLISHRYPDMSLFRYYLMRRQRVKGVTAKIEAILNDVALPSIDRVMNSYPFELSGGMKQRVLIGMALADNPSLILADEPGTALDVTTNGVILDLMRTKVEERSLSIIYVTHNLAVARENTQRIYVMYAGQIAETGPSETIFAQPKHPYTAGLIRSLPRLTGGEPVGIEGAVSNYYTPPLGCRFWPRCQSVMDKCKKEKPSPRRVDGHDVSCHLYG